MSREGVGRRAGGVGGEHANRLRALNVPEPAVVRLDVAGRPATVAGKTIEVIVETWRVDDEWWRAPIVRRYHEVVVEGGGRMILFEDVMTSEWFVQMP
jgi:hypothetical protein